MRALIATTWQGTTLLIATLISATSLFSLAQSSFAIDLYGMVQLVHAQYATLRDIIFDWIPIDLSVLQRNLATAYLLFGVAYNRALVFVFSGAGTLLEAIVSVALVILAWPLFVGTNIFGWLRGRRLERARDERELQELLRELEREEKGEEEELRYGAAPRLPPGRIGAGGGGGLAANRMAAPLSALADSVRATREARRAALAFPIILLVQTAAAAAALYWNTLEAQAGF